MSSCCEQRFALQQRVEELEKANDRLHQRLATLQQYLTLNGHNLAELAANYERMLLVGRSAQDKLQSAIAALEGMK